MVEGRIPEVIAIRTTGRQLVARLIRSEARGRPDLLPAPVAVAGAIPTGARPLVGDTEPAPSLPGPLRGGPHGRRFRHAAVSLAASDRDSDESRAAAAEAAMALVALAEARNEPALRELLRPDPALDASAWTVACYQIGDLTPSAIRDFSDPCAAVATLAVCEQPSHLAAELVASTSDGLRWTALIRTGESLRFQPLNSSTSSGDETGRLSLELRNRWEDQLLTWAGELDWPAAVGAETGGFEERLAEARSPQPSESAPADAGRAAIEPSALASREVTDALALVLQRLEAIERSLEAMTARIEALGDPAPTAAAPPRGRGRTRGAHSLRATVEVHLTRDRGREGRAPFVIDATTSSR